MRRRTKIIGATALITVLMIAVRLASQKNETVGALRFGCAMVFTWPPPQSGREQMFLGFLTNNTGSYIQVHHVYVESEFQGFNVVRDHGPAWSAYGLSDSVPPSADHMSPFGVEKGASRFRVIFECSRGAPRLRWTISRGLRKLPLKHLPRPIYSWLRQRGLVDGFLYFHHLTPWIANPASPGDGGIPVLFVP